MKTWQEPALSRLTLLLLFNASPLNANQASTTRYWDCSGGACGCGYLSAPSGREAHCHSNALFSAPLGNVYGAKFYGAAAVSEALGGGFWLAEACGKCFKVTGTSNVGPSGAATTLVLKATNFCPPANQACSNGRAHFDIAAPGFDFSGASLSNTCSAVEPSESNGFSSCGNWMISSSDPNQNCDCSLFSSHVLRAGCENFLSLGWNNVDVAYEEVTCPLELSRLPCWEDNGESWPNNLDGFCKDPGVPSTFVSSAPVPMGPQGSTPSQQPIADPTSLDGYCSWAGCDGNPQGGDWCNESAERCISCGGGPQWCVSETSGTSSVPSNGPSQIPSTIPSSAPSASPSNGPSIDGASASPSTFPSSLPSRKPSKQPTDSPVPDGDQSSPDPPVPTAAPNEQSDSSIWAQFSGLVMMVADCIF